MAAMMEIAAGDALAVRRLLVSADAGAAAAVAHACKRLGWATAEIAGIVPDGGGVADAIAAIEAGAPPSLLIIDLDGAAEPLAALDRIADACLAETRVIAIGSRDDARLFRALIAAGVSDYLVKPVDADGLAEAMQRIADDDAMAGAARSDTGRLVAVMGVRGGCGATTVAASLAWMMAGAEPADANRNGCILVDLDLHFGSAALTLGVDPGQGLAAMLASPDRLDEQLIAASLRPVTERLGLVAAELPVEQDAAMAPAAVQALMAALCTTTPWVVADLPRRLDPAVRQTLRTADAVVLVLPPTLEGLRDAGRLLGYLSALRAGAPPLLVVNGADGGVGDVSRHLAETTLGQALAAWIPVMAGPAAAAAAHALPLAAVVGSGRSGVRGGNPFAALAGRITGAALPAAVPRWRRWWQK
jgi:pilus assembly protein CpaE